jgi:hypothetical protein
MDGVKSLEGEYLGGEETRGCQALAVFTGVGGGDAASCEAEGMIGVVRVSDEVGSRREPEKSVES